MRADRLLSLLMLLQARGRMTARQLAEALEVSERTVYRDIEALSVAGVPVYAERGPGGGCALLDEYRTNLTGLTDDEVRALFMLSIPAPLAALGVSAELRAAWLKLAAALPAARRDDEARVRQRVYLDPAPWSGASTPAPHVQTLHRAIWEERQLHVVYSVPPRTTRVEQQVSPYGLVAKADAWHLVGAVDDDLHVIRVSAILDARILDTRFVRTPGFDLVAFWDAWCARREANRPYYPVTVRVSPALLPRLPLVFGDLSYEADEQSAQEWTTLTLVFDSLLAARSRLLGLGRAVEVLEPRALRASLIDFAAQIVAFYGGSG